MAKYGARAAQKPYKHLYLYAGVGCFIADAALRKKYSFGK
jgi:hypothetical protein